VVSVTATIYYIWLRFVDEPIEFFVWLLSTWLEAMSKCV